jgi:hypothetical protein
VTIPEHRQCTHQCRQRGDHIWGQWKGGEVCLQTQTRVQHQREHDRSRKDIIRRTIISRDGGCTWILEDLEVPFEDSNYEPSSKVTVKTQKYISEFYIYYNKTFSRPMVNNFTVCQNLYNDFSCGIKIFLLQYFCYYIFFYPYAWDPQAIGIHIKSLPTLSYHFIHQHLLLPLTRHFF